jgi:hypothetical protein
MPIGVSLIGGTLFLAVGGLFVGLFIYSYRRTYKKITHWHVTEGTVVGYGAAAGVYGGGGGRRGGCRREVEFQAPSGVKIVFTESVVRSSSSLKHAIGCKVKVLYSPDNPSEADISSFGNLWNIPLVCFFIGVMLLLMSVLFYMAGLKAK